MRSPALRQRDQEPVPDPRGPAAQTEESGPAVDLVHLARQTLGDRNLEVELLGLFTRQARTLLAALELAAGSDGHCPAAGAEPLHILCGSARAVGCWAVADVAHRLEREVRGARGGAPAAARLVDLRAAVDRACAAIEHMLGG